MCNKAIRLTFFALLALSLLGCTANIRKTPRAANSTAVCDRLTSSGVPSSAAPAIQQDLPEGMRRANIIIILVDDMDAASLAYMPKVKELLVDKGTSFANYIINVSLCCPSRATTLLGMYSHNTEILTNNRPNGGYVVFRNRGHEKNYIATSLKDAGYRTGLLGKYLNGYPIGEWLDHVPPGWMVWYSPVDGNPYSNYNYSLNENGNIVAYGDRAEDYLTDVLANKTESILKIPNSSKAPFFIYLAPYAPHGPAVPAPRHTGMFQEEVYPRVPSFNEEDVSDKPKYIQELEVVDEEKIPTIDAFYRNQLQSLQAVDEMVARLVKTLEETDQLENTYIFFTSDNGLHMWQHRLPVGKKSPYDEDIRVPLIVRGPGIPAGNAITELAGNTDLAPTFLDIAGVVPPSWMDGRSLLPLLAGKDNHPGWRDAYLIEHWAREEKSVEESSYSLASLDWPQLRFNGVLEPPDILFQEDDEEIIIPEYKGLRTTNYTYIEYVTGERELYDLKVDPFQLQNLAASADNNLIQHLSGWLACMSSCAGDQCRYLEQAPEGLELP